MELRQLRSFAALAEEQHFGRAAARLHLAQPALSQQIKQLERELGVTLVNRTTRRVELTAAGIRLREHARTLLATADRAAADMALLAAGHTGQLSLGFIGTATYDLMPAAAREIRRAMPHVQLELRGELLSPDLLAGLAAGRYDLVVIRPDDERRAGIEVQPLRTEKLVAVLPARHHLAQRKRIDLAGLADDTFVMHPSGHRSSIHDHVIAACAAAGFRPRQSIEVGETATLVAFVAAGMGVALVPEPVRSLRLDGVSYVALTAAPRVGLALAVRTGDDPVVRRAAELITAMVRRPRR